MCDNLRCMTTNDTLLEALKALGRQLEEIRKMQERILDELSLRRELDWLIDDEHT